MRRLLLVSLLLCAAGLWAQSSPPSGTPPANPQMPSSSAPASPPPDSGPASVDPTFKPRSHNLPPPRSDSVSIEDLGNAPGDSSSKATQIDLSPPADDSKAHPQSSEALMNAEFSSGPEINEVHAWNPHKAAKDIEVGDFYFKRKNYRAAEDRYREALFYKPDDADATFRLAVSLEKLDLPDSARSEYESYLKILPAGPQSEQAKKAIARLNAEAAKTPAPTAKPTH
jgi:hypothetical protein